MLPGVSILQAHTICTTTHADPNSLFTTFPLLATAFSTEKKYSQTLATSSYYYHSHWLCFYKKEKKNKKANLLQCANKTWVICIEPNSGNAAGILHIFIVTTAVTLVTSTPQ